MGAEVTLLGRMIFRIDKDGIVGTSGHAGFAAYANRFVKIDNAIRPLEHRRSRTGRDAWGMRALVAARYLMRAPHLGKHADVDMLNIGARDADWDYVFRLAGCRARMTPDAASVIDDFGPLDRGFATWFWLKHVFDFGAARI